MRDLRFHNGLLTGTATLLLSLGAPAHADTLREALTQAYETNPLLQSARARQREIADVQFVFAIGDNLTLRVRA